MDRVRMRTALGALALVGLVGTSVSALATPASAATAKGCRGTATSTDADGGALDRASAPGKGGTEADPFTVDLDGFVAWQGITNRVMRSGTYSVKVGSVEVASGDIDNQSGKKGTSGVEDVNERLGDVPLLGPVLKGLKPTATMRVDWKATGSGASCTGTAYLQVGGAATFTPLWFIALVLLLAALGLLFWPGVFIGGSSTGGAGKPAGPQDEQHEVHGVKEMA